MVEALLRCLHGGASSRQTYELGGPQIYTLREIVGLVAKLTGRRRWIIGLPDFVGAPAGVRHELRAGASFLQRQLSIAHGRQRLRGGRFAKLGIKPQSMVASARQYLGALEDNARLSQNRAAAGRATH